MDYGKQWLGRLFAYGDHIPESEWVKIVFRACSPKHPDIFKDKVMVFTSHICLIEGYRVIPNFPRYGVSESGTVIENSTRQEVPLYSRSDWYPTVSIFDDRTGNKYRIGVHRLVALAWCDNDDVNSKIIIDHIDGDKYNCHYKNLEWVTYSENALRAFKIGLRSDNLPCKIRSIKTGEIREYHSFGDLSREFGKSGPLDPTFYTRGPASRLLNGEWEVRANTDERPWHYKVGDSPVPKSQYVTTVTYPDGTQETYWDNRDIIKKFKCWNISSAIGAVITKAQELHPELVFEVVDRREGLIIQTLEVATMTVVDESKWVRNAAKLMNCSRGVVERYLRLNLQRPKNGYVVRYKPKDETPWAVSNEESVNKPVCIQVTDTETNTVKTFHSLREIERELNVSRFVVQKRLLNDKPYRQYLFKTLS